VFTNAGWKFYNASGGLVKTINITYTAGDLPISRRPLLPFGLTVFKEPGKGCMDRHFSHYNLKSLTIQFTQPL
jgi:hypothetical protein